MALAISLEKLFFLLRNLFEMIIINLFPKLYQRKFYSSSMPLPLFTAVSSNHWSVRYFNLFPSAIVRRFKIMTKEEFMKFMDECIDYAPDYKSQFMLNKHKKNFEELTRDSDLTNKAFLSK